MKKEEYTYSIVEGQVARESDDTCEVYQKGKWVPFDEWHVATNGRVVTEEQAMHFIATGEEP